MRPPKSNVLRVTSEESSPINESTSKWKIPHYYKMTSSSMSQTVISEANNSGSTTYEQSGTTNSPAMALGRSNNRINIMNTPVAVLLEDPNQPKTRKGQKAKAKKNGEMVFVNFTVRDTAESPKKTKTARQERMIRMLKSSENTDVQSQVLSVADTLPVIEARSAPASTPTSASKRSYSSFLKSGKIGSSTISSAGSTTGKPNSASPVLNRETATHNDDLSFTQRSNSCNMATSSARITPRPQISRSTSANVVLHCGSDERLRNSVHQNQVHQNNITFKPMGSHNGNGPLTESNNKIDLLKKKFLQTATSLHSEAACSAGDSAPNYDFGLQNSPRRSCRSKANTNEFQHPMCEIYTYDHDDNDEHGDNHSENQFMVQYDDYEYYTANNIDRRSASKQSKLHRSNTFSTSYYNAEENDASIAFNKIFTRKRQNAGGGSTGSAISSQHAASPYCFPGNVGSISVSSQRYSPNGSFSPGISRTNTRGSFSNRITRDVSSAYLASANANDIITSQPLSETVPRSDFVVGIGTYIDTQVKQRYCHKKKQESISGVLNDPHRYTEDTPLMASTAPTPGDSVSHILQGAMAGPNPSSLWYDERETLFTENYEEQDLPVVKSVPTVPTANIAGSPGTELGLASVLLTSDNIREMELPLVDCNSTSAISYQNGNGLQRSALETLALGYENNSVPDKEATQQKQMQEQLVPFYSDTAETGPNAILGNRNILENYMEFDIENAFTILLAEAGTVQYDGDDSSKDATASFNSNENTTSLPLANVSPLVAVEGELCSCSGVLSSSSQEQQQQPEQQQQQQLFQCNYKFPGGDYQRNVRGELYGIIDNKEFDGSNVLN